MTTKYNVGLGIDHKSITVQEANMSEKLVRSEVCSLVNSTVPKCVF